MPSELTSFVGRRHELAEIKQRLGQARLVTLTGPGGVGKTRLAIRAAKEMMRAYPDGVWLVALAGIQDPLLVTQAAFDALGVHDLSTGWSLTTLADYLANKHLLLILDNCEHLLDSCAVLTSTLLKSCPELQVLATSRQPFGTAGEARMLVPPLTLPEDGNGVELESLLDSDAVTLLSERAALVRPSFVVDSSNAAAVARLCRRLDGMPLALELAAVRLSSWSLDQLILKLDSEMSVLAGGNRGAEARQQTLEATIGWSYGLLEEGERVLWARLSVFSGGFDQEAAIDVCSDGQLPAGRIVDLLGTLVEKSVLRLAPPGGTTPRYTLLETLRQYGALRLCELGEETRFRKRQFDWIRSLAQAAGASDDRQRESFNRIHMERENVWAALQFCLGQPAEASAAAELARNLMVYWICRGPWREVQRVIAVLAELAPPDSLPRARLLWVQAAIASALNDYGGAAELSREALRIGKQVADAEVVAGASLWVAVPRFVAGDLVQATNLAHGALSRSRLMEFKPIQLATLMNLSLFALVTGDHEHAAEFGEQAVTLSRECGEVWIRAYALNFLAQARWMRGDWRRAEVEAREGAACSHELDDRVGLTYLLETLAWIAAKGGANQRAATILGSAERVRELSSLPSQSVNQPQHQESTALAVDAMGRPAFDVTFNRGRAMTIDEAVDFALDRKKPPPQARPRARGPVDSHVVLTRREQEISGLVGQGLSNKQIAAKLVVSERTAESHILNILNKLGFNSRTQIASWEAAREPATNRR